MLAEELARRVRSIKGLLPTSPEFTIAISTDSGKIIGFLRPITNHSSADPEVVKSLTRWRQRNMQFFLTQFTATFAKTATWLEQVVIPSDDRLLFLICADNGRPIGNIGVCHINPTEGELDNVIRGETCEHPRFMFFTTIALLGWLFLELGLCSVRLHVFSNNEHAIKLYASVGFRIRKGFRLFRSVDNGELRYLVESDLGDNVTFKYLQMVMDAQHFVKMYPWIANVYTHS